MSDNRFYWYAPSSRIQFSTIRGGLYRIPEIKEIQRANLSSGRLVDRVTWRMRSLETGQEIEISEVQSEGVSEDLQILRSTGPISPGEVLETVSFSAHGPLEDLVLPPGVPAQSPHGSRGMAAGTMVMTTQGEIAVEALEPGQMLITRDRGFRPLRWVGQQNSTVPGVLIPAGAIKNHADMILAPEQNVLLQGSEALRTFGKEEVLAPAEFLVSRGLARTLPAHEMTWYQVMFEEPQIIYCQAISCESFAPTHAGLRQLTPESRSDLSRRFGKQLKPASAWPAPNRWHLPAEALRA